MWKRDLRHGFGEYTYTNRDRYEGAWYKNERHGVGTYHYYENGVKFRGTWKNDIRMGPVEINYGNHRYHGIWNEEYPVGPGCFSFDRKYIMRGFFMLPFASGEEEEEEAEELDGEKQVEPVWKVTGIEKYEYKNLPQEPLPYALPDSDTDVCVSSASEDEHPIIMPEEEEGEEEEEEAGMEDETANPGLPFI